MRPVPNPSVYRWVYEQPIATMATTVISVMEIRYGLLRLPDGRRKADLQARFKQFMDAGFAQRVLSFDLKCAECYAAMFRSCEARGRSMEPFDCMIAAIAKTHSAVLATRNVSDFELCEVDLLDPWNI